jgi:hypothetical protein
MLSGGVFLISDAFSGGCPDAHDLYNPSFSKSNTSLT